MEGRLGSRGVQEGQEGEDTEEGGGKTHWRLIA